MDGPFTKFVRDRVNGVELTEEALDPVWAALRGLAAHELKRRGLWWSSPILLGIAGAPRWIESGAGPQAGMPGQTRDALDELVTDLWSWILVERAKYLYKSVALGGTVESLVVKLLRQAISDWQKRQDRLGFSTYRNLVAAVRNLVNSGELKVVDGDPKVGNDSVLAFDSYEARGIQVDESHLADIARRWSDELLVPWVTGRGHSTGEMVDLFDDLLRRLGEDGFEGFSFKRLADALKVELRQRLAATFAGRDPQDDGATDDSASALADVERRAEPSVEDILVERAKLDELSVCVERRLRHLGGQQRTRDQILLLWRFHYAHARGEADPEDPRHAKPEAIEAILSDELPSFRGLGRILDLRHDRVADLSTRLIDEVARCRELLTDVAGGSRTRPAGIGSEASVDEKHDLRSELRRRTVAAFAGAGQQSTERREGLHIGDLVSFPEGLDEGIEWLVLPSGGGRLKLVAADAVPWMGSRDFEFEGPSGPLVLRFGQGFELGVDILARVEAVAEPIGAEALDEVASFHRRLASDDFLESVDDACREIDFDPDYRDHCQEIGILGRALAERLSRLEMAPVAPPVAAPGPEGEAGEPTKAEGSHRIGPRSSDSGQRISTARWVRWLAAAALLAFAITMAYLLRSHDTNRQLDRRIAEIEAEHDAERRKMSERQHQLEQDVDRLRAEVERLEVDADPVLRKRLAAKEAELAELASRHATEIAVFEKPGITPKLFAPLGIRRGPDAEVLTVDEDDPYVILDFADAREGDRLEISTQDGREVWSEQIGALPELEATYRIPSRMLPPGEKYIIRLLRGENAVSDFELWIVRPEAR